MTTESPVIADSRKAVRDQIDQIARIRGLDTLEAADIARTTFKQNREDSRGTTMYATWELLFKIADEEVRRGVH